MNTRNLSIIALILFLALFGCGSDDDDDKNDVGDSTENDDDAANDDATDDDAADDDDSTENPATPESIIEDFAAMIAAVEASMNEENYFHDHTWHLHFGDGLMYGPSFDLATYALNASEFNYQRAIEALDDNLAMVEDAVGSLQGFIEAFSDVESIAMAMMGMLEAGQFIDASGYAGSTEQLANMVDRITALFDDYLPPELGEFAGATYGPTAISSLLALLRLGLVISGPADEADSNLARAKEILENIHKKAWSEELGFYRFAPDDDRLMLYPNATMMLSYGRLLEVSKNVDYVDRIEAIYDGIQGLRAETGDHYYSPYSREEAGAEDEDYATLSSQNYLMIGLWLAFAATGDQKYLDDIDLMLSWIESHLFADEVLKHHWVNGRTANEEDLYDFCSGCNLQTLYIYRIIQMESEGSKL